MNANHKRRWYQFSLRTFVIVLTLFAVWLGYISFRAREQRAAVARIQELGGHVQYDYQYGPHPKPSPPGWLWLRRLVGDEYFQNVARVSLNKTQVSDEDLRLIGNLRHTRSLSLSETDIGDEGLAFIRGMSELNYLGLGKTKVTSAGIRTLRSPRTGCIVVLTDTSVGNEALPNLSRCGNLVLDGTPVTSQGIKELVKFKNLKELSIEHTSVDDAAVPFLVQITALDQLFVDHTKISGDGLLALRDAIPKCWFNANWVDFSDSGPLDSPRGRAYWKVVMAEVQLLDKEHRVKLLVLSNPQITDDHLALLEELDHVESLDLRGSSVTGAGVEKLQKALPHLRIHR